MAKVAQRRRVRRLPPEKRIADILAAAKAVFDEKGYNAALISDIAERAGVVEGSIYRFFANKRELLLKVVEQWYVAIVARYEADFPAVQGTWNQIHFLIHQHLMAIKSEPGLARLLLLEIRLEPDYRQSSFFRLNRVYVSRIIDVVKRAIANGEFRPDVSPALVRDLVYGTIEHQSWSFLRREGDLEPFAATEGIIKILRGGLGLNNRPAEETPSVAERLELATAELEKMTSRLQELLAHAAPSQKA